MRHSLLLAALIALCLAFPSCRKDLDPERRAEDSISPAAISAHVRFLSDNLLEGRGVGARGGDLAALYIAAQFAQYGLEPAGDDHTYFQRVPLVGVETLPSTSLSWNNHPLRPLTDYVVESGRQQASITIDAPVVYVGHGIVAPEFHWDDYQGFDVKDKIVVLFTNEPQSDDPRFFGGKALTYYGRWTYKYAEAARRGALGCILLHTDKTAGYGFQVLQGSSSDRHPQVKLAPGQPALALAAWVTEDVANQMFAAIGKTVAEMVDQADSKSIPPVTLPFRIRGRIDSKITEIESSNVVARLPGNDPARKDEAVLYTAHWDHLGIGAPVNGDAIYNGALDNGSGCGILLEMARAFSTMNPRPSRSILFAAVTAEEAGLLGSAYLSEHPPVPAGKIALDLNYDELFPYGRTTNIRMNGYDRTTVRDLIKETAAGLGLQVSPDFEPEQGHFYRSDHFSLAHAGVPALSVQSGDDYVGKPAGWGRQMVEDYNKHRYHQPSDEFDPGWDFSGLAVAARFGFRLGTAVANLPRLPTWQPGDEFLPAREKSQSGH